MWQLSVRADKVMVPVLLAAVVFVHKSQPHPTPHRPAEYEVDFINNFTKLTSVGTTFNPEAYLTPEQTLALKF
jgi:hypothetical protein